MINEAAMGRKIRSIVLHTTKVIAGPVLFALVSDYAAAIALADDKVRPGLTITDPVQRHWHVIEVKIPIELKHRTVVARFSRNFDAGKNFRYRKLTVILGLKSYDIDGSELDVIRGADFNEMWASLDPLSSSPVLYVPFNPTSSEKCADMDLATISIDSMKSHKIYVTYLCDP